MSFLTLNGLDVPVREGTPSETPREIGQRGRAFDGTARVSRRATKREWSFDMLPQSQDDAIAYEGLIRGDGHVWSFDASLYSSKGLSPSAQSGTVALSTSSPKFGAKNLALSGSSVASSISWQPGIGSEWTVALWRFASSVWTHYVLNSNGTKLVNAVSSPDADVSWLTVSAPNLSLSDTTATAIRYDDLIFFPFVIPAAWVGTLYGKSVAWTDAPKLTASGDALYPDKTVFGEVTGVKQVSAVVGGSFADNARVLSVSLVEV